MGPGVAIACLSFRAKALGSFLDSPLTYNRSSKRLPLELYAVSGRAYKGYADG